MVLESSANKNLCNSLPWDDTDLHVYYTCTFGLVTFLYAFKRDIVWLLTRGGGGGGGGNFVRN